MSKTHSNKAKGRKGQQEVQQMILDHFPELAPDDCRSNPMGSSGEDILLSPRARKLLGGIQIEVKRKKAIGAVRFIEQSGFHGSHNPCVFFREDRGKWYTMIESEFFFELVRSLLNDELS